MKVTIENVGSCQKRWTVAVPAERVRAEYETALDAYCREARLDGFRPGRAPRALVEKRFGERVRSEVNNRLRHEAFQAALREAGRPPLVVLDLNAPPLDPAGGEWSVVFSVEVEPEFDLPPYKGLTLQRRPVQVEETDIEQAIVSLRRDQARFEAVQDRTAERGDLVRIDFEGSLDGRPLEEALSEAHGLGKAEDFLLYLGEESPLPGFVEAHLGVRVGDTRTVESHFPDDFSFAPLRGRTVRYETRVKEVQRPVLPELTEEWLKQWGVTSADELRARIREGLHEHRTVEENRRLQDEAWQVVMGQVQMDLPPIRLQELQRLWLAEIVHRMIRGGASEAVIKERAQEIVKLATDRATEELRTRFVVEKIARTEQISVEEKDMNEEFQRIGLVRNEPPEELRKRLETSGGVEDVRQIILRRKVINFILAHARVEDA